MICCFSISIALMLLSVGSRPMPRLFLVQSFDSLSLVCALVRNRILCVCVFSRFLHCLPAFSCRPNLKNLSIKEKKLVAINFRGLASQKMVKSWDLNINTIIKPIILHFWCTVLYLLLARVLFHLTTMMTTTVRHRSQRRGGKTHYTCVASCMRNISKWATLLIFDVVSITFDWKWMNLWIIEYVMFFHKSFVLSRRQWCLSYVCFCMPPRCMMVYGKSETANHWIHRSLMRIQKMRRVTQITNDEWNRNWLKMMMMMLLL